MAPRQQTPTHDPATTAEAILAELTKCQFVRPHQCVREAVGAAATRVGFCTLVSDRAAKWLEVDPSMSIGRLRRTELTQLARCIDRYWRATTRHPVAL